ncbi:MAG: SH3 domain-containing protein [Oscillospiraceae bacterium]|nr:SH3 domain-containing protein [Oscillospiraceae bacterium]
MLQIGLKKRHWLCIAALIALMICLASQTALASEGGDYYMGNTAALYSDSTTSSGVLEHLAVGEPVKMYSHNVGKDGAYWHYIEVLATGQKGYIQTGNITTMNARQSQQEQASQGNAAASGQLVVSNSAGASLKDYPTSASSVAATVQSGTVLSLIGTTTDINGSLWYYVSHQGQKLYVRAQDVQSYQAPTTGGGSGGAPAAPGNGSTATAGYRYVVTATRYVNMRSAPSTSASVVAQVPAGEMVVEQMSVLGTDSKIWRYVSWGTRVGYMRSDYLTVTGGGSSFTPPPPSPTPTPPPSAGYKDFVLTYGLTTIKKEPTMQSATVVTAPAGVALRPLNTYTDDLNTVWYQVIYSTAGNDQAGYVQRNWVLDNPTWDQLVSAGAVTPSPAPNREGEYASSGYLVTVKNDIKVYGSASLKDKGNGNYDLEITNPSYTIKSAGTIVKLEKTYYTWIPGLMYYDYIYHVQFKVWSPTIATPTPKPSATAAPAQWLTYSGYILKGDLRYATTQEMANANNQGWGSLWQPTAPPTPVPTQAPPTPYQVRMGVSHVALRTGPATSASMVTSIAPNETAQYLSQVTGADGYVWYQVSFYGRTGWVRSDLCSLIYPGGAVQAPSSTAGSGTNTGTYSSMMAVTNSGTNMRTGMGTSFGIVTKLSRGEIVQVKGSGTGTDGNTWYQVTSIFSNKTGYVRGDLLRQLTAKEQETYGSSSSGGGAVTAPPTQAPSANATLKLGMTGPEVAQLQSYLTAQSYLGSNYTSGTYDAATLMAVRRFQEAAGLSVDGVAGSATLTRLYSGGANTGGTGASGGGANPGGASAGSDGYVAPSSVELNSWTTGNIKSILEANPVGIVVVSVDTGASFRVKYRWGTNHADCEPQSAADTAIMNQIKASYGTSQTRYRMPVWVKAGGHTFAASMYAEGHDASSDTIPDNNFSGVMCLHFKDSATHTNPNGTGTSEHQQEVMYAYTQQP